MLGKIILFLIFLGIFFGIYNIAFADSPTLLINEVYTPTSNDWVELYNPTLSNVDLTNWTLSDSDSNTKQLSGTINALGFVFFNMGNYLNNSGDSVFLKDPLGNTVDSFIYTSNPGTNYSFGRFPDGGAFNILSPTTQNSSNNISASLPIPSLSPSPSPSPSTSPTPSPFASPTFSPSPTPSPSPSNIFQVSTSESSTDSDSSLIVNINLNLPTKPNTPFYLKGAFYSDSSANYFGYTQVLGTWIKNSSSFTSQFPIQTDSSGLWNGEIEVMPDPTDTGFLGSGNYNFKIARYSQSGDLTWSNSINININQIPTPTPFVLSDASIPYPSLDPTQENSASSSANLDLLPQIEGASSISALPILSTPSNPPLKISTQNPFIFQTNPPKIVGLISVTVGLLASSITFLKSKISAIPFNPLKFLLKKG